MKTENTESCYHCGETLDKTIIEFDNKQFCCNGCQTVYDILSQNDLCDYYRLEQMPGISPKIKADGKFAYLENEAILDQLLDYRDESISKIQLYIPQIHCSSCLWLLENLYKLHPSIQQSRVNFLRKEIYVSYQNDNFSLRKLIELLSSLGYEPEINLDQLGKEKKHKISRRLIYQVGLAGFAFGNIMLLSLPEYFGLDSHSFEQFSQWFGWLNLIIATPVAIYSGQDYFKSAWVSIKRKRLNIDVPIALGVFVLYFRSSYEVISQTGPGYFDSLCGLLFFLLLGRLFQEKTYHRLSFERDYRSYFPISITLLKNDEEISVPVNDIKKGDRILIRNGELIPVDAILMKGNANIDNSFATGESIAIEKEIGDRIYAGGKQMGEAIELEVLKPILQSKLTRLWNEHKSSDTEVATFSKITDQISVWFTPIILLIALVSGIIQLQNGVSVAIQVVSAILIVACPCALALAAPFTFGHASRWLGRRQIYLRESSVIENLADIKHIVFDKTGTITQQKEQNVNYEGEVLTEKEAVQIRTLLRQSNHPLSRLIIQSLQHNEFCEISNFKEIEGKGMQADFSIDTIRMGSSKWIRNQNMEQNQTSVHIEINQQYKGKFIIQNTYREGLSELIEDLKQNYQLSLISGDNDGEMMKLKNLFPPNSSLLFQQSPEDKLHFIEKLQNENQKVMMIGDGLNDAGALKQSDVGLALAEDVNAFSPACDLIMSAEQFNKINATLKFAKQAKHIVIISFIISFLYNIVGLSFAVQGLLSPVFAAILMPISSVSVVGFSTLSVWFIGQKMQKKYHYSTFSKTDKYHSI